jgi:hypothetical protein
MTTNFQFKSSLIDYTYDGQGYSYTITPNDWTTIDVDQIAFGQFISLMSDIYSGAILAINRQRLFDHFEIKLSEIDHGPSTSVDLVTALIDITETDITSAVTPSVIFDLQTEISDTYATIASPAFTGTPTAPTATLGTDTTQVATTAFANAAAATAQSNAEGYADGLVVNLWDDRGTFSAAAGTWPTSGDGGSGVDNSIMKGDTWSISTGGTLTGGKVVAVGDVIRALVDGAGNTSADWGITENNLGYTAENSANKATDLTSPDNTKYPTTQAVATGLTDTLNLLRYVITTPAIVANAYAVTGADVNAYGNKILKLTSASAIAVSLPNPNALTPAATVGDSFNIRQGGAGVITITGTITGASTTAAINTTITLIAESATSWMSVGG